MLLKSISRSILYLSAPGDDVFGKAPELSYSEISSAAVTMDSVTLNPISSVTISLYLETSFDCALANTKRPFAKKSAFVQPMNKPLPVAGLSEVFVV